MLIAICGIDGSGKTTQCELLALCLRQLDRKVSIIKPAQFRGTPVQQLVDSLEKVYDARAAREVKALLAAHEAVRRIQGEVAPLLLAGDDVICDRYVYSLEAYAECEKVDYINIKNLFLNVPQPNVAVLLDVPPEVAWERISVRGYSGSPAEDPQTLALLREAFLEVARRYSLQAIDGTQPVESIAGRILDLVAGAQSSVR